MTDRDNSRVPCCLFSVKHQGTLTQLQFFTESVLMCNILTAQRLVNNIRSPTLFWLEKYLSNRIREPKQTTVTALPDIHSSAPDLHPGCTSRHPKTTNPETRSAKMPQANQNICNTHIHSQVAPINWTYFTSKFLRTNFQLSFHDPPNRYHFPASTIFTQT